MRIILDENYSFRVAELINERRPRYQDKLVEVLTTTDLVGASASDIEIHNSLKKGDIYFTLDINQSRNIDERISLMANDVKVVFIRTKRSLTLFQMAQVIFYFWDKINSHRESEDNILRISNQEVGRAIK